MRYAYDTLKLNCIRRKGVGWFELTFEEFAKYAHETRYLVGKGRSTTSFSIDRIDNTMGYFIGNIKTMTVAENSRKHTKILNYQYVPELGRMVATLTDSKRGIVGSSESNG